MELLRWLNMADGPASPQHLFWASLTVVLSTLVVMGYGVIAFNWYFQSKLGRSKESRAAVNRLRLLALACATMGIAVWLANPGWVLWRVYDASLLLLGCFAWTFAFRMRGLSLIEERLAQVADLEQSVVKYREIAELLPHIVWTAAEDGRIDFTNQRWFEYVGDGRTWLEAVHPDERAQVREWWHSAIATHETFTREIRLSGMRGYRTFAVRANPIIRGQAVRWIGACADIEDQKQLAAERETQSKQKLFFLNALSHDLRAPLNNIVLNAQLLKMSPKPDEAVESAEVIVESALAAADLVTRLLDFARHGTQDTTEALPVSITALLRQLERRFLPIASRKGLYLRLAADADAQAVTDRYKLERIVSNLVDNAIKFTQSGGITLELRGGVAGASPCIRVHDTGVGIPLDSVPYLFDEFYQVHNHERDPSKGFGMGLAICRCLARQLGGDVRLVCTGPQGSCFEIVIDESGPGGGRRSNGQESDHTDSSAAGLCSV